MWKNASSIFSFLSNPRIDTTMLDLQPNSAIMFLWADAGPSSRLSSVSLAAIALKTPPTPFSMASARSHKTGPSFCAKLRT